VGGREGEKEGDRRDVLFRNHVKVRVRRVTHLDVGIDEMEAARIGSRSRHGDGDEETGDGRWETGDTNRDINYAGRTAPTWGSRSGTWSGATAKERRHDMRPRGGMKVSEDGDEAVGQFNRPVRTMVHTRVSRDRRGRMTKGNTGGLAITLALKRAAEQDSDTMRTKGRGRHSTEGKVTRNSRHPKSRRRRRRHHHHPCQHHLPRQRTSRSCFRLPLRSSWTCIWERC
jgi:hypothetical protein